MAKLYLGDPEFMRKMRKVYSWVYTVVFAGMSILLLISQAWIPALIFIAIALLNVPLFGAFFSSMHINGMARFFISALLVVSALALTGLYL